MFSSVLISRWGMGMAGSKAGLAWTDRKKCGGVSAAAYLGGDGDGRIGPLELEVSVKGIQEREPVTGAPR